MAETVGAILVDTGRVLLGLRAPHKSFAGCWDIIGGHIEAGESRWTALCRELMEELGIECLDGAYLSTLGLSGADDRLTTLHIYSVHSWNGQPSAQDDEHTELRWFLFEEIEHLSNLATNQYKDLIALARSPDLTC